MAVSKKHENIQLYQELNDAGVTFLGGLAIPGGGKEFTLLPEEIDLFCSDKVEWFARKFGVAPDDYRAWVDSEGTPRCGKITANGKRCGNFVSGGSQMPLDDWLREDAGLCKVHGGAGSDLRPKFPPRLIESLF